MAVRAGHRGVVTRHINEAKTILENRREHGHVEEELTVAQVDRLNVISLLLLEKQKTLSKIDQEVLELCELTEIEREIQESENIVSKNLETKQQIKEVQKEVQVETEVNRTSNALETNQTEVLSLRGERLRHRDKSSLSCQSWYFQSFEEILQRFLHLLIVLKVL